MRNLAIALAAAVTFGAATFGFAAPSVAQERGAAPVRLAQAHVVERTTVIRRDRAHRHRDMRGHRHGARRTVVVKHRPARVVKKVIIHR